MKWLWQLLGGEDNDNNSDKSKSAYSVIKDGNESVNGNNQSIEEDGQKASLLTIEEEPIPTSPLKTLNDQQSKADTSAIIFLVGGSLLIVVATGANLGIDILGMIGLSNGETLIQPFFDAAVNGTVTITTEQLKTVSSQLSSTMITTGFQTAFELGAALGAGLLGYGMFKKGQESGIKTVKQAAIDAGCPVAKKDAEIAALETARNRALRGSMS